ncbi:hypothetical protein M9H77_11476 [Catharanthus roseus]|uniref:Uncharacterized protein n=1 Tax=Catharanthus roseus TaxID=4058 RepID=A0ACC0BEU2_CATRO|nr:hypothetical protein M9H77_11476 [Catharanthus roseus]
MDSKTKDVVEDLRSHATKFSKMHNPGLNEKASISLSKEVKRDHVHKLTEDEDSDFLKCLNTEYTSILNDPNPGFSIDCGDDPSCALFLCSLKNDGSSYVLEANEKTRLTKPLKYVENDPDGEDENDLDSHAKTEGIEFQNTNAIHHETTSKGANVNNHCGSPQQRMCSNFRVQILEILCKPYDKEEHERLMQEITKWKPQHKQRDLRSRGNLTDEESFIPWNDKECVDVQLEGS